MKFKIKKASEVGFCFGVKRAIDILEKSAKEYGNVETFGEVVHNEQVMQRLAKLGIDVVHSIDDIAANIVAISSHGVSPQIEQEFKSKKFKVIDTTCPFVKRAQRAAKKLSESGFYVLIYGDSEHSEVKGILGWADGKGIAAVNAQKVKNSLIGLRRIGILSQTTQIPEKFTAFTKEIIDLAMAKDVEIRILDTICHDIRKRQEISLELSKKVELMLVIGGGKSANSKRLQELCSTVTETHLIDTFEAINFTWLQNKIRIGITSGTSTSIQTIDEIVRYLNKTNNM